MTWNRWLLALQRRVRPTRRPRRLTLEALEDRSLFAVQVLSTAVAVPTTTANGQSEVGPMHSISDDGRYTVFVSTATNLVANQGTTASQTIRNVYLYDKTSNATTLLSHQAGSDSTSLATAANSDSVNPVISGDGKTILFLSLATNLISGETFSSTTSHSELYLYDNDPGSSTYGSLKLVTHTTTSTSQAANAKEPSIPHTPPTAGHFVNTLAYNIGTLGVADGLALASVSSNGQYIAYISDATNLAAANTGGSAGFGGHYTNVYLYDRQADTNTLVSHTAGSDSTSLTTSAGGYASTAAISADGSTIAFTDPAGDVVSGATVDAYDDQLYVWSRINNTATGLSAGQTVLASHKAGDTTTGASFNSSQFSFGFTGDTPPSLSSDGTAVAYYFAGSDLVNTNALTQGRAGVLNVFRYNVVNNTNELVTHAYGSTTTMGDNPQNQVARGNIGPAEATGPAITPDGRYIAYANNSSNLVSATPFSNQGRDNVYLYDSTTHTNTLVSHADGSATTPLTNGGTAPSISADGRYVSFLDWALPATGSTSGQSGGGSVRLYDAQASSTAAATVIAAAIDPATTSSIASSFLVPTVLSADGSALAWDGNATGVVSGVTDTNNNLDVFLYTTSAATTTPAQITSANSTTFTAGLPGTFTVTVTGSPAPTLTYSGDLPSGVTFTDNGNGTGTLSGTPAAGTGGPHTITFTAHNGVGTDATQNFTLIVNPVTGFTPGDNQTILESAAASPPTQRVDWATNIVAGSSPVFTVTYDHPELFATPPAISPEGTLTYQAAQYAYGTATVQATLTDSDGNSFGPVTFTITILHVNQPPSFTLTQGSDHLEASSADGGQNYALVWATNILAGPANESNQTVYFEVLSNDHPELFVTPPTIDPDGTLRFQTAADAEGTATITVRLRDNGGTDNGGQDYSDPVTFTIMVSPLIITT
jgi:hypothetical protein